MSIYEKVGNGAVTQSELNLYGSSRLGLQTALTVQPVVGSIDIDYAPLKTSTFTRGEKAYEITNHLGNVLATVSDQRQQHSSLLSFYFLVLAINKPPHY